MTNKYSSILIVFGLILLTFFEYRTISIMQVSNLSGQIDSALGVLSGHPHWKTYQSRLLGPVTVAVLSHFSHQSFSFCYQITCFILLIVANSICFFVFRRAGGRPDLAWAYTFAYASLFAALQDRAWLYLWDYIDLLTLMLFAYAVFTRAPLWKFVVIFFIELLNREAANFIALWIIIDSVNFKFSSLARSKRLNLHWRQAVTGFLLIVVGVTWTNFIRDRLFVHQALTLLPGSHMIGDEFWELPHTLHAIKHAPRFDALVPIIVVSVIIFSLIRAWEKMGEQAWKICLLLCGMVTSIFMFAIVTETRVWFEVLPFLFWLIYRGNSAAQPSSSRLAVSAI